MKNFILKSGAALLAEFSILAIIALVPIFFNYFYPTSIDLCKIVIFKIFTLLLLISTIWRFSKFKISITKNILTRLWPLILLFVFLFLSLFFSVDIATSWFGSYERQEGLISWVFYGLWALLVALHLGEEAEENKHRMIRRLLVVSTISGFLVSVYALLQLFGIDFITWQEPAAITGRAVSSFGQPNYLACWLLIVLPFSAYLFYTAKNNLGRFIFSLFFVSELAALLSTGSRAALLAFLGVSVLWCLWFLSAKKILSRRKTIMIILSGVAITSVFTIFLAISNPARFSEISDIKKGSAYVRLELWQAGLKGILQKPLLGYGLENQKEAYVKYYKVNWAVYSRPDTYSDRAHNLFLDFTLTGGVIGLGIFVYFLRWVYLNLLAAFKKNKNQELSAFLLWSLTAYLVSLLFNFSVTVTNIYFWLIVGLSLTSIDDSLIVIKNHKKNSELARIILVIGAMIIFLYGSFIEISRLEADYYYNKALSATINSEYFTALVLKDYLDETHPDRVALSFYNQGLALRLIESLPRVKDKSSTYQIKKYLASVETMIPSSNFENKFVRSFALGILGHLQESDLRFQNLALISPELPKIYLAWGDILFYNRNYLGAKVKFEKTLSLLPDANNPYVKAEQKIRLESYKEQINFRLKQTNLLIK